MDGYEVLYGKLGCCTNSNAGLKRAYRSEQFKRRNAQKSVENNDKQTEGRTEDEERKEKKGHTRVSPSDLEFS